jgi:hypothetical protein
LDGSGSDSDSDSVSDSVTVSGEGFVGTLDGGSSGGGGDGDFCFVAEGRCLLFPLPKDPSFVSCDFGFVSLLLVCADGDVEELGWWSGLRLFEEAVEESESSAGTAG